MRIDVLDLAAKLDRWAKQDRECNSLPANADTLEQTAAVIRELWRMYSAERKRVARLVKAEGSLRTRLASAQAEAVGLRSDIRALEIVAGRPSPESSVQDIEVDSKGNLRRITTRPVPERRPAGFSA